MRIDGAVAVVTGASSGIGEALARELSARGAKIALAARRRERLEAIAAVLPSALAIEADMTRAEDVERLFARARETFGRVDILVNNAGRGLRAAIGAIDIEEYRQIIELNVIGALRILQNAAALMRNQEPRAGGRSRGVIVNVSSMVSKNHFPFLAAYASTKYALNALSYTAREELAGDGINVLTFYPRMTATDFGANALGTSYDSHSGRPGMGADTAETVARAIAEQIEDEAAEKAM